MVQHRKSNKNLGPAELIVIALGGMVGCEVFTVFGISVSLIGNLTLVAIIISGAIPTLAAYFYIKIGLYYRDERATCSFFERTYLIHWSKRLNAAKPTQNSSLYSAKAIGNH